MNYKDITTIQYEGNCTHLGKKTVEEWTKNAKVANKKAITQLIKKHHPKIYSELGLKYVNPHKCYRTNRHLILTHAKKISVFDEDDVIDGQIEIEYFFAYNQK